MAPKAKVTEIRIDHRRCKGCEICVAFCPKKVLELKDQKAWVVRLEDCIGCDLCEIRCPDFAVQVIHAAGEPGGTTDE